MYALEPFDGLVKPNPLADLASHIDDDTAGAHGEPKPVLEVPQ